MPPKKNKSAQAPSWCKVQPISSQSQPTRKLTTEESQHPPLANTVTTCGVTKGNKKPVEQPTSRKAPTTKKRKPPPPPDPWVDPDDCMEIPANTDTEFSWMDQKVDEDALVDGEEAASDVFHDGASSCNGSIDGMSDDQASETSHTESEVTRATGTRGSSVNNKATMVQYDGPELEMEAEVL